MANSERKSTEEKELKESSPERKKHGITSRRGSVRKKRSKGD